MWDGWGIILGWVPIFFRDIWSHKTSETLFLFVILVGCAQTAAVGDPMVVMRLFASFLRF